MKAGQLASFASFGPAVSEARLAVYRAALARLQNDVPPMATELARQTIESELGRPVGEVFAELELRPFAAASIGQVHAARLHDGREVVLKVQYPGAADAVRADLANTELLVTLLKLFALALPFGVPIDLRAAAAEIAARLHEELDYHQEARHQRLFAARYDGHPFIHVPQVLSELCTGRLLVQERARGLSWHQALEADQQLRDQWGEAIYRFSWGGIYRFGCFNADPQPGNFLFGQDGTITALDFGCVKQFDAADVDLVRLIWGSAIEGNPRALWHTAVEVGLLASTDPVSPEALLESRREGVTHITAPQPYRMTPQYVAARVRREYSPTGPSADVMQHLNALVRFTFLTRIDLGMMSLLGELCACADWQAIDAEQRLCAPPRTALGRLETAFFDRSSVAAPP